MLPAILAAYIALPIVIGVAYFIRRRASLRRPWLFLVGGIFEGFLVVAAVLYWALEPLTYIGISGVAPGDPAAADPYDPYHRAFVGLPIATFAHLFVLWVTHRAVARP